MKVAVFSSNEDIDRDNPVFVGIDASLTAFAVCAYQAGAYESHVFYPSTKGAERLAEISDYLLSYLSRYEVADIFMEGMFVGHRNVANPLGELHGVVKEKLYRAHGISPVLVPPSTMKKYVCGTGKSVSKAMVMMMVYKKWGVEIHEDNAADAYALARMCSGAADHGYEVNVILQVGQDKYRE